MTKAPRRTETPFRLLLRRSAWMGGALVVLAFAIEGGEYGTRDVLAQRIRKQTLTSVVMQLRADVDSLRLEYTIVTKDTMRLERIAREQYGMVRGDKELLYFARATRVVRDTNARADSTGKTSPRG